MKLTKIAKLAVAVILLSWGVLAFIPVRCAVLAQSSGDSSLVDVHIGVLGLFHPTQFTVSTSRDSALVLRADEERIVIEKSSGIDSASIRVSGNELEVSVGIRVVRASKLAVNGRNAQPVDFVLAVPGKIARRYHGTLEIKPSSGTLTAVVAMNHETAVASVVAAENTPETPFEALEAQAVAARSYFVASHGRHQGFDFCDTTHCQFLREPPAPQSAAARAVAATRDLVLAYDFQPIAALYTRSCGGRTRTPAEVGLSSASYPYYSVDCPYCRSHPVRWSSRISARDAAALQTPNESARLKIDRRLGWSAVPSNDFVAKKESDQIILNGRGEGHGIGLCQSGARAMAEDGADFRQVLTHYYPNTTIVPRPGSNSIQ
jgi:peptidoglycan hydrolase-like amidase